MPALQPLSMLEENSPEEERRAEVSKGGLGGCEAGVRLFGVAREHADPRIAFVTAAYGGGRAPAAGA